MGISRAIDTEALAWQAVRPDLAHGVYGKTLLAEGVKVVLTCVAPGGGFPEHRDGYGHLFYFLEGEGRVQVEGQSFAVRPGVSVRVAAGDAHAYENPGEGDLLLLSLNLPEGQG